MANFHLRDRSLSNKARGLLSTMLSLPEAWDYTTRGLAAICKDGVDGITAQLKELEENGYLLRRRIRDDKGRISDVEYIIYEEPHQRNPDTDSPYTEKPDMDMPDTVLPCTENPAQINKDKRNTDESITDLSSNDSIPFFQERLSVLAALEAKRNEATVKDMSIYRELIKENIDYDILLEDMPYDRDRLDEIVEILTETVCSTRKQIRVGGNDYPAEVVRSKLLKLDAEHGGKCILQLRGVRPFLSDKYDITKHPNYKYLSDADDRNNFDIEKYLSTRLKAKPEDVYETFEVDIFSETITAQ